MGDVAICDSQLRRALLLVHAVKRFGPEGHWESIHSVVQRSSPSWTCTPMMLQHCFDGLVTSGGKWQEMNRSQRMSESDGERHHSTEVIDRLERNLRQQRIAELERQLAVLDEQIRVSEAAAMQPVTKEEEIEAESVTKQKVSANREDLDSLSEFEIGDPIIDDPSVKEDDFTSIKKHQSIDHGIDQSTTLKAEEITPIEAEESDSSSRRVRARRTNSVVAEPVKPEVVEPVGVQASVEDLNQLHKVISAHKYASPFRKPVTKTEAPDYFTVISEPMDLGTIKKMITNKQIKTLEQFCDRVFLVFQNATTYNMEGSDYYVMAEELRDYCVEQILAKFPTFDISPWVPKVTSGGKGRKKETEAEAPPAPPTRFAYLHSKSILFTPISVTHR
eukprot:c6836_g1_i3.p1 GENE.c6836_g1_i3~~c6836_g1_i3.p1  ORF type:complete len:390 (-),score=90.34 c6836_g1_i3:8-1177(-)